MKPLTWRTYRKLEKAPVPVVQVLPPSYRLTWTQDLPNRDVFVGSYKAGRALRSGDVFEAGNHLPADVLREDVVLLELEGDVGLSRVIARPQRVQPLLSKIHRPKILGPQTAMVIGEPRPAERRWETVEPEPVGEGLFSVPAGLIGPCTLTIDGVQAGLVFDYDPYGGMLYVESQDEPGSPAEGTPLPADSALEFTIRVEQTCRRSLTGQETTITSDRTGEILAVAKRQPEELIDIRRLPEFDPATKWHAVGQAHYDAGPVPGDMYFIIRTDASDERVQRAVDRSLPAGAVYRIEPLPETMSNFDFRVPANSGYLGTAALAT